MSDILDTLPGLSMSVRELTRAVESIWDVDASSGSAPFSEYRASQMNLVIHLGPETPVVEAEACFERSLAFARVYPCRIIVLIEQVVPAGAIEHFGGKLFSQCYLGRNLRDRCCCEALILEYPQKLSSLVESQVSLWLEADLPLYYWPHRVEADRIKRHFGTFLKHARRVIFDRVIDGAAYAPLQAAEDTRFRDLAFARTLRLRQTLGHILSAVPPDTLVDGLRGVEVLGCEAFFGEAAILLDWVRNAVLGCAQGARLKPDIGFDLVALEEVSGQSLSMNWRFRDARRFLLWNYKARSGIGLIEADFGSMQIHQPVHIEPLDDAMLLAEAMFFG